MSSFSTLTDAERMDKHYRYQRYIYDGTRTYYLLGRSYLINELRPSTADTVLEIGCGTAWNLIKVARAYPYCQIFGLDVSQAMLNVANRSLKRRDLLGQVEIRQGDAIHFDSVKTFGIASFDRIFFSYALSMIPSWRVALEHALSMLAQGGELHIVDFGQCHNLPPIFKRVFFPFLKHYTVHPHHEMKDVIEDLSLKYSLDWNFRTFHKGFTDYAMLRKKI